MKEMKRAAVTGGAGFIGSHLCRELIGRGFEVTCIDNLYTGSRDNIRDLEHNPAFRFVEADITDKIDFEADLIYNLACPASPVHYQSRPLDTIRCSTFGVWNMLEAAERLGARILQASTSEVYGDPAVHPQSEGYWGNVNPIGIRSCYDEGKRIAECMCMEFARRRGVEVRLIRIFNTYGPSMAVDDGRVISNFLTQAIKGEPITIYGDGSQTRSFQYVSDLVEGMIRMMELDGFTGPVNLGNPGEYTIRELAEKISKLCGSKSEIVYRPLPGDDPRKRKPDISLAREKLGWAPVVPLDEGLAKTKAYFESKLGAVGAK